MADFHQNGNIATLHNLRTRSLDEMTYELETFAQTRKMALILPCLYSELETEAMPRILAELSKVTYLHRIIIGLDRADEAQFRHAKEFFKGLNQNHIVIWNDSPRMLELQRRLEDLGLAPDDDAVQVGHRLELGQDVGQRRAFKLGVEARQDQRDLPRLRERRDLVGKLVLRTVPQVVQRRDVTVLVKVRHGVSCL